MSQTFNKDTSALQTGDTFDLSLVVPFVSSPAIGTKRPQAVINNESGCSLELTLSGGRNFTMPAGAWTQPFTIYSNDNSLHAHVDAVLPNSPVNKFSITVYRPDEDVILPMALGNSPIGISGNVQTSNVQSLTNDNNPPTTNIIESTPSDQTTSSIKDYNDASGIRQILSAGILRTIYNFVRGNASTTKASLQLGDSNDTSILTFYGLIGAGSVVPTSTLSGIIHASDLNQQLSVTNLGTSPANKTTLKTNNTPSSTYELQAETWDGTAYHPTMLVDHNGLRYTDAAGIQPGTIPSGVNIPGSQVTGDIAANQVGPGALDTDVTMAGAQITSPPWLPLGGGTMTGDFGLAANLAMFLQAYGATLPNNTAYLSGGRQVGTEFDVQLVSVGQALSIIADYSNGIWMKCNNYYDGTNDRFITANAASQFHPQSITAPNGTIIQLMQWRHSANTPTAGGIISWTPWFTMPILGTASGSTGTGAVLWSGTADPGNNAVEGDWWLPG